MTHPHSSWDPLGAALRAYRSGQHQAVITVRNSVQENEQLYASYFFRKPDESERVEQELLQRCSGTVLDVGAGAGVHALYLQEKGLAVTAIDVSEEAVTIMRELGVLDAHYADIFEWKKGPYDTLLMLMNGIGIVGTLERLRTFFVLAKKLLKPGGKLLLESTDILYAYTDQDGSVAVPGDHYFGEISYQMTFDGKAGDPFPWLFIDPGTLSLMAEEAGFSCDILHQTSTHNYAAELKLIR